MDKPRLSLNDDTDYGLCFACGPRNAAGLHLMFQQVGDTVTTTFRGREEHQGFPGHVHGGVISALLDEVMSRVPMLDGRWAMTARMDLRFRRPVMVGEEVTAVAKRVSSRVIADAKYARYFEIRVYRRSKWLPRIKALEKVSIGFHYG